MRPLARVVIAAAVLAPVGLIGCQNTDKGTDDRSAYTSDALTMERDAMMAYSAINSVDETLKSRFYDTAYAYAVFPKVTRGGVVIGAASGEGMVFRGPAQVGTCTIEQVTVGAQVGGQTFREVIFFQNQASLDRFRAGPTEISANASAIVIKNGAGASNNYVDGVAVFVQPTDGLMLELSVGGQKFWYRGSNRQ